MISCAHPPLFIWVHILSIHKQASVEQCRSPAQFCTVSPCPGGGVFNWLVHYLKYFISEFSKHINLIVKLQTVQFRYQAQHTQCNNIICLLIDIVILQFEKASTIHSHDIGNEGSAFVEILVGKSTDVSDNYQLRYYFFISGSQQSTVHGWFYVE